MRIDAHGLAWAAGGRTIIEDVDLVCEPGTVTGLLGPNGSGKTTLLHVLAGLRRPSAGRARIGGDDLHRMRGRRRALRLSLVEQDASTRLDLTVRQVVELGRVPHRGRWQTEYDDPVVEQSMRLADVETLADRHWSTLSGGERQRTHLARAIAQEPAVLLLDEPTNHLDLGHQIDFLARVRGLGLTTVAALHDLELAAAFCDHLVVLDRGRVAASGPVGEVLTDDLVADVWGVDANVVPHPVRRRPHLCWNDTLDREVRA
ncbi:histidinol phosphatase [Nocardioides sp. Soil797]|nr:histidinol phosphatase [Nocardioides sp. Soil797]